MTGLTLPAADEQAALYERRLRQSIPHFYWFRNSHAVQQGRLQIRGSVICRDGGSVDDLTGLVNGLPAKLTLLSESPYTSDRFWFLPARNRFDILLDAPVIDGATMATASVFPKHTSVAEYYRHSFHVFFDLSQIDGAPPLENVERVSGKGATNYSYFNNGVTDFYRFAALAQAHGIDILEEETRILDWGCGCARLTRHFLHLPKGPERVIGIDIDSDNIAWSSEHVDACAFRTVGLDPPTEFADGSCDLVLANSVLSHLKADSMLAWLAEVRRILRPGGLALLSYHGEFSLAAVCAKTRPFVEGVWENGFNADLRAPELDGLIADNTYYRQTYMTDEGARRIFERFFLVEDQVAGIVSRFQNVAVLRRPV